MEKLLCALILILAISSCTSAPLATPPTTPTRSSPAATQVPPVSMVNPTANPVPGAAVENLLAQQLSKDLSAFSRPVCDAGTHNEKDWVSYGQLLAPAISKLFSDPRSQSLSSQTLVGIFKQGSGLALDVVESSSDALLVTIVNANCNNRTGGGSSPAAPRDMVLVANRRGGIWQIGQVANVLSAGWSVDHWVGLVTATDFGGGAGFEVWNVRQVTGQWKSESAFQFTQSASLPLPRLSADGAALTLYSPPAACNLPKNITNPNPTIESDYKLQNGQYQCIASRVLSTPVPTRAP
jgi:hypothetical protein